MNKNCQHDIDINLEASNILENVFSKTESILKKSILKESNLMGTDETNSECSGKFIN